jgi:sugar lactone lactonase YvrE
LVGTALNQGNVDGVGAVASFQSPTGITVDKAGIIYVAQANTLRRISSDGTVSTLAGLAGTPGSVDGTGSAARFNDMGGLVVDTAGNVIVTDQGNHTLRKVTPAGVVTTLAGTVGVAGGVDGVGAAASFNRPSAIATDSEGNFYVTDQTGNTVRKVTANGVVTTIAGTSGTTGHADGTGAVASFNSLNSIAINSAGNIYVVDQGNNLIRKITPAGVVTTVVGTLTAGFVPGPLPGGLDSARHIAFVGTSLYITTQNGVAVVTNMP